MRILIVSRAVSYMSKKVYDVPDIFKPARKSIFALKKLKNWTVDILFLNYSGIYNPKTKNMRFSWIYEAMPSFMFETIRMATKGKYDFVMVVEPDIILPQDALINLMHTFIVHNCDIAIGIYPERPSKVKNFARKGQPLNGWLVCMPWNNNPKAEMDITRRHPFEIEGCAGFGCVLMNTKLMRMCSFPQRDTNGNGPDFAFYESARSIGLKIYANPDVRCGHIENNGKIIRGPNDNL